VATLEVVHKPSVYSGPQEVRLNKNLLLLLHNGNVGLELFEE
jgi:hypothetical protein